MRQQLPPRYYDPGHPNRREGNHALEEAIEAELPQVAALGLLRSAKAFRDKFEYAAILDLLERTNGDVSKAARLARIPRNSLSNLLNKHTIDPHVFRTAGRNT